jgi:hypothetical protein
MVASYKEKVTCPYLLFLFFALHVTVVVSMSISISTLLAQKALE